MTSRFAFAIAVAGVFITTACGDDFEGGTSSNTNTTSSSSGAGNGGNAAGGNGGSGAGGSAGVGAAGGGGSGGEEPPKPNPILVRDQLGNPLSDVKLVANYADGSISGSIITTNAAGTAEVLVPDGGSVSAFFSKDLYFQIAAIIEPPAATTLVYEFNVTPPKSSTEPTTYTIYPASYPAGTDHMELRGTCYTSGTAYPNGKFPDVTNEHCPDDSMDFLFAAYNDAGDIIGWAQELGASKAPGEIVEVTAYVTQTAFSSLEMSLTNIPAAATAAYVSATFGSGSGVKSTRMNVGADANLPTDALTATLKVPSIPGAQAYWRQTVLVNQGDVSSGVHHIESSAQPPPSSTFDADSFTWLSVNPLDVSDPEHPQMSWSSSKQVAADFVRARFEWQGGTANARFEAVVPITHASSIRVPEIPDELSSYRPTSTSTFEGVYVECFDFQGLDGFEDAVDGYDLLDEILKGYTLADGWNGL